MAVILNTRAIRLPKDYTISLIVRVGIAKSQRIIVIFVLFLEQLVVVTTVGVLWFSPI